MNALEKYLIDQSPTIRVLTHRELGLSYMPCPLPQWTGTGASVGCFPAPLGPSSYLRRVGVHDFTSRPAQASLTLRPAGLLNRPRRPLSRGFGPPGYPNGP